MHNNIIECVRAICYSLGTWFRFTFKLKLHEITYVHWIHHLLSHGTHTCIHTHTHVTYISRCFIHRIYVCIMYIYHSVHSVLGLTLIRMDETFFYSLRFVNDLLLLLVLFMRVLLLLLFTPSPPTPTLP